MIVDGRWSKRLIGRTVVQAKARLVGHVTCDTTPLAVYVTSTAGVVLIILCTNQALHHLV
jgi:hypothetical protein